jgi:hypothetical protein
MIRLDSCHIEVKTDAVKYWDNAAFTHKPQTKNDNLISDIYELTNPMPGIKSIKYDCMNELLKLQLSAKILNDKYFEGINKNTMHNAIDNINQLGIIDIDANKLIDNGIFHTIDNTNNLDMEWFDIHSRWKEFYQNMTMAKNNNLFAYKVFDKSNNKGITFKGDTTSVNNRLIMYGKFIELTQPKNKLFLASCSNPLALLNTSKNIIRVESNITSHKSIKHRCKTTTTNVNEVLSSIAMPNIYMLDKITQPNQTNQTQIIFDKYEPGKHTFDEIAYNEGLQTIIRMFNYDENQLKQFILCFESQKNYEWILYGRNKKIGIRKMIQQMKQTELTNTPKKNIVLAHLRQLLLNDYAIAI